MQLYTFIFDRLMPCRWSTGHRPLVFIKFSPVLQLPSSSSWYMKLAVHKSFLRFLFQTSLGHPFRMGAYIINITVIIVVIIR